MPKKKLSIFHFLSCLNVSHRCNTVPSLQNTLLSHPYQSVITFGGCRDDFMVVTSQQREPGVGKKSVEKLIFAMAKPKVKVLLAACNMQLADLEAS